MKLTRLSDLLEDSEVIKGRWEITRNCELQYRSKGKEEEIKFKAPVIAAEPEALIIAITERQSDQKVVTSIAKITGTWRLDAKNRINFETEKEIGKNDILTFKGSWDIGENHQIVYRYQQTKLKTKKKEVEALAFNGYWDISEKNRLTYFLGKDTDSAFRFRGAFQTKSILAKEGAIKYQAGIEIRGKHKLKTIALFGKWVLSHDLNLSFKIEYEEGQKKAITFGSVFALKNNSAIEVDLESLAGEKLGSRLF